MKQLTNFFIIFFAGLYQKLDSKWIEIVLWVRLTYMTPLPNILRENGSEQGMGGIVVFSGILSQTNICEVSYNKTILRLLGLIERDYTTPLTETLTCLWGECVELGQRPSIRTVTYIRAVIPPTTSPVFHHLQTTLAQAPRHDHL